MKTLFKTGSKILASLTLMVLVMLNLQVGVDGDVESSALEFVGLTTTVNTMEAQAAWCDYHLVVICSVDPWGVIYGTRHDGLPPIDEIK